MKKHDKQMELNLQELWQKPESSGSQHYLKKTRNTFQILKQSRKNIASSRKSESLKLKTELPKPLSGFILKKVYGCQKPQTLFFDN